jgi:hypothetical protein
MRVRFCSRIRRAIRSRRALGLIVLGPSNIASSADALSGAQRLAAEETQDDAFAVRDDADLPFVRYAFGDS